MTSILSLTQLPPQSREPGITPREQLECLAFSQLERELGLAGEPLPFCLDAFFESAVHSILRRSGLSLAASDFEKNPSLFNRSLELLVPARPFPLAETNWYTALKSIGALPTRIPPLPVDIHEILEGLCPIYKDQTKPDGTPYKIKDTHILYLIPAGTVNELEQRISAYGQQFFQGEKPLKFSFFWSEARQEYATVPNSQPQWVLISKDVLPGSREQTYTKQVQVVDALSAKSLTDYQVPTLREASLAIFLHKIATGESLYNGNSQNEGHLYTYTRVKETTLNRHLIVGGFAPSGLYINGCYGFNSKELGVAAVRKL